MSHDIIQIVDYRPEHAADWARLTQAWLAEGGFAIEAKDRRAMEDPHGAFLADGGRIFIAERGADDRRETIGCCALIRMEEGFEVCKMTVSPAVRGTGLGRRLLAACEAAAREVGATRLYLETNSVLAPAIGLYESFGFVHLPPRPTPYARADVFMEKRL